MYGSEVITTRARRRRWTSPVLVFFVVFALAPCAAAQAQAHAEPAARAPKAVPASLVTFLLDWVRAEADHDERLDSLDGELDTRTWYVARPLGPARGFGAYVVYLSGNPWCADDAAGCTLLVVATDSTQPAPAYRVIGQANNVHLPVSVLPSSSHGWPDLAVWVYGGGPGRPRRVRLRFDGQRYPDEAWRAPLGGAVGRLLVTRSSACSLLDPRASRGRDPRFRSSPC